MQIIRSLFLLLFCLSSSNLYCQSSKNWSKTLQIQWEDFKGKPNLNSSAIAMTASGLNFEYATTKSFNGELEDYSFKVEAQFFPNKSWYKKDRANAYVLDHERLHFDITELFARQLRQKLLASKFTKHIDKEIDVIYKSIKKQLSKYQELYDLETNHSRNVEKQKEWQKKVNNELQKLANYSS